MMLSKITLRIAVRVLAALALLVCLRTAHAAPLGLVIVPGAGTVITGPLSARCEFVTRPLSDESPLTHTFLLRNDTKEAVTIERIAVSCDCVQAQIGESGSLPVTVAPGKTVRVQVSLSMGRLIPGTVSKSAWIYPHGSGDTCLQLEMRGTVRDDAPSQ